MITISAPSESALAISTSWRWASERSDNRRVGLEVRAQPRRAGVWCATTIAAVSIRWNSPNERGSRPKKTLAATSRLSNRFSSWWTKATPQRIASETVRLSFCSPRSLIDAGAWRRDAAEDSHQGALARSVFSDQPNDLTRRYDKVDMAKGPVRPDRIWRCRSVRGRVLACLIASLRRWIARTDFRRRYILLLNAAEISDTAFPMTTTGAWPAVASTGGAGLLALPLLEFGPERIDVGLVDDLGRDDDQLVGRDEGFVALQVFGHVLHALIAPFIGLLHDGADDRSFLDAAQRNRVLVEADDGDLLELAGVLERLVDPGRVVGVEADHAS